MMDERRGTFFRCVQLTVLGLAWFNIAFAMAVGQASFWHQWLAPLPVAQVPLPVSLAADTPVELAVTADGSSAGTLSAASADVPAAAARPAFAFRAGPLPELDSAVAPPPGATPGPGQPANAAAATVLSGPRRAGTTSGSAPARLRIETLNIDLPIVTVPVAAGQWDMSQIGLGIGRLETTGRFPGDHLAMALAGHITAGRLGAGPFRHLSRLRAGDLIEYIDPLAGSVYYQVESAKQVSPLNINAVYVPNGSVLLLMTCSGYDLLDNAYLGRLLVRAVQVPEPGAQ
jgi:LPXTG-site transpeptidase (sortase) family protein